MEPARRAYSAVSGKGENVKSRCGRRKNTWRMTYLGPDRGGELRTEGTPNLKTQEARKTWIQDSAVLEHTESHLAIK